MGGEQVLELEEMYGTVYKVIWTLFEGISGGNDWSDLAQPVKDIHEFYNIVWGLYVLFVTLGVLNVVTGFFVDGSIQSSRDAREDLIQSALMRKAVATDMLREMFYHIDADASGDVTLSELEESCKRPEIQQMFLALELDLHDTLAMFNIIDFNSKGAVNIDDFIEGCLRLTGGTNNSADIATIICQSRQVIAMLTEGLGDLKVLLKNTGGADGKLKPSVWFASCDGTELDGRHIKVESI
eukprot:NODE_3045_length_838_cov_314.426564.p1 GENE.NODE_3045_length_838_cov_314.426564~~NODE_3045_length_838_cov_314.426564.p1  ORF type:complete len:240 (-),score=100.92 NODE_3045_length_838_cov_314.426564:101-820(-)